MLTPNDMGGIGNWLPLSCIVIIIILYLYVYIKYVLKGWKDEKQ